MDEPIVSTVLEQIDSSVHYIWSQTLNSVEIELESSLDEQSHQWSVTIESDHLKCSLNENTLIDAKLFDQVNVKDSSYVILSDRKHQLVITLQKSNISLFWNDVFKEGRSIAGGVKIMGISELTETNNDDGLKQPYNSQQLEECDLYTNDNDTFLCRLDGNTHKITHQALIYNQILFTKLHPPSLCIRHDVRISIHNMDSNRTSHMITLSQ
jgi:hypothetical protein